MHGLALDEMPFCLSDSFEKKQQAVAETADALRHKQTALLQEVLSDSPIADATLGDRDAARLAAHGALDGLLKQYSDSEASLWQKNMETKQLVAELETPLGVAGRPKTLDLSTDVGADVYDVISTGLEAVKTWWASRFTQNIELQGVTDAAATTLASVMSGMVNMTQVKCATLDDNVNADIVSLFNCLEQAVDTERAFYHGTEALVNFPKETLLNAAASFQHRCLECLISMERLQDGLTDLRDRRKHLEPYLRTKPDVIGEVDEGLRKVKGLARELIGMNAEVEAARLDDDEAALDAVKTRMRPIKEGLRRADRDLRNATAKACQLKEDHFPEIRLPLKAMPVPLAGILSNCKDPHQLFDEITPLECDDGVRHNLWMVKTASDEKVLKQFPLRNKQAGLAFQRQLRMMLRLAHPSVVPIEAAFYDEHLFSAYIQMPKFPSNLEVWMGRGTSPQQLSVVIRGVLFAIHHVHACGVVHGDLKPTNVLMTVDDAPVLTDFEFSCNAEKATVTSSMVPVGGTLDFIPPEVQNGARLTKASDIYSLGVIFSRVAVKLDGTDFAAFVAEAHPRMISLDPNGRPTISELTFEASQHFARDEAEAANEAAALKHERQKLRLRYDEIEKGLIKLARQEEANRIAGAERDGSLAINQHALSTERQSLVERQRQLEEEVPPPPPFWNMKNLDAIRVGKHESQYPKDIIEDILTKTAFLSFPSTPCTCCGTPPPKPRVVSVTRIENVFLWKSYCPKRREIVEWHEIDRLHTRGP